MLGYLILPGLFKPSLGDLNLLWVYSSHSVLPSSCGCLFDSCVNSCHSQWPKLFGIASPHSERSPWYKSPTPIKECPWFPALCAMAQTLICLLPVGQGSHTGLGFRSKFHGGKKQNVDHSFCCLIMAGVVWLQSR